MELGLRLIEVGWMAVRLIFVSIALVFGVMVLAALLGVKQK